MAKLQVIDWDTTAANNQDVGSIAILGTSPVSNFDNALREIMAEQAAAVTRHVTKAVGSYTALKTDHNQLWRATGAVTLNLTAAATLTTGWALWVKADGGAITVDPSGAETINGAATLTVSDGSGAFIVCTGTAFFAIAFLGTPAAASTTASGIVELATDAEAQAKSDTARALTPSNLAALGASTTFAGLSEFATAAEYRVGTDTGRSLVVSQVWSAGAEVTLTDAATIAVDLSTFINAQVTLGGNRTLGTPSNQKTGQTGCIRIIQDGTGNRTLAYAANWVFANSTAPVLSTGASKQDLLFYYCVTPTVVVGNLVKAVI